MIDWSQFKPEKGKFLLSEPTLFDPNFARTVCLLVEHNTKGSLGFVLNRPLSLKVSDLDESLSQLEFPLYEGGPVQLDTLHYVHSFPEITGAEKVFEGVFWGGELESLLLRSHELNNQNCRFFLGYSGWGTGQLDMEVEAKTWIINRASKKQLFTENIESLWEDILRSEGGDIAKLANYPRDPSWN